MLVDEAATLVIPVFAGESTQQYFTGTIAKGYRHMLFITNAHCVLGCCRYNLRPYLIGPGGARYYLTNVTFLMDIEIHG
jgi:hypothetical protein